MAYDLDLFRRLNAEYATRTIVDLARLAARTKALSPPLGTSISYDDRVRAAAKRQLGPVRRDVALADKTVLELGCGHGYFTAALVRMAGAAHVIGVDIELRPNWNEHRDPNVTFVEADISAAPVIPPDSVDV